ncbi:lysoplasmalogenase [Nocardioides daphniae]|uniref:Lysoplasmalogenase n=1 Tax=Nocardioides daphniae TaxID=402297 RepID=A0A4P7UE07_9ACTN|nr:lysoplasmalogenase [Nocardioides daphniae]QCC78104.1 lysoplasmalogenase [Nocardioides daphniae]GGD21952.1 hypothetical protein GCM10007231_21430 [Nocardioides daphniae]
MRTRARRGLRATVSKLARVRGVRPGTTVPFWAVTGVHLLAQLGIAAGVPGASVVAPVSKALLLPALALVLGEGLTSGGRGVDRRPLPAWWPWAAVGVTFSWFGDLALISPDLFLAGVGLFGVAQVAYAVTFVKAGDPARTAGRPALLAPYAVWWLALAGFFLATGGVNPFLFAVGTYGLALGSMAFLAHRISPATATGAALFVLSDSLIGLGGAGLALPAHGFWVMLTYLVAQWLIVRGLVQSQAAPVRSTTSATSDASTLRG